VHASRNDVSPAPARGIEQKPGEANTSIDVRPVRSESTSDYVSHVVVAVAGRVVSSTTGLPLIASIASGDRRSWTDSDTGRFVIDIGASKTLNVASPGYIETLVEPSGRVDVGDIRLVPSNEARILVVSELGVPVPGATVEVLATECSDRAVRYEGLSRSTGDDGSVKLQLAGDECLFAHMNAAVSDLVTYQAGEAQITLILAGRRVIPFGLWSRTSNRGVADATVLLSALSIEPTRVFVARTGSDGRSTTAIPDGRYALRIDSSWIDVEKEITPFGNTGDAEEEVFDVSSEGETQWIYVSERPSCDLIVLGADEEPLENVAISMGLYRADRGTYLYSGEVKWHETDQGRLSVGVPASSDVETIVWARGFSPYRIRDPAATLVRTEPLVVRLQKAESRSLVLVTNVGEYQGECVVCEQPLRLPLFVGRSIRGEVGPFGWSGGDIIVTSGSVSTTVSSDVLTAETRPIVMMEECGAIEMDVPVEANAATILCVGARGGRWKGSLVEGRLSFVCLPAGGYEVGPVDEVATLPMRHARGLASFPVVVEPGKTTVVQWEPSWSATSVRGHVSLVGIGFNEVFVAPVYGEPDLPIGGGRYHKRFRVNPDGTYEMVGLAGLPSRVLVGRIHDNGYELPIAIGAAGEEKWFEASCAEVMISCENVGASERIVAEFHLAMDRVELVCPNFEARGVGGAELVVHGVPTCVDHVSVASEHDSKRIELKLRGGESRRIVVQFDS